MIRTAVVGLGAIASTHIRAIEACENAQLAGVCDLRPEKAARFPAVPFYTSVEEMLHKERPDCLHICLPHHLHIPVARLAAQNHVNVFLEKPPALTSEELRRALGLEAQYQVKIGVCLQNRYNPTTQTALEIIRGGTLGAVVGCKAVLTWDRQQDYYSRDPWRGRLAQAGGGLMLSQAIHTLDLMTLFCGNARTVNGRIMNLKHGEIEVEDTAVAQIRFEGGAEGIFYGTVGHRSNSSVEIELVLEEGLLRIKDNRLWSGDGYNWELLAEDAVQKEQASYYGAGHGEAIARFYSAVENAGGSYITLCDTLAVMELIEGVVKSSAAGGAVSLRK